MIIKRFYYHWKTWLVGCFLFAEKFSGGGGMETGRGFENIVSIYNWEYNFERNKKWKTWMILNYLRTVNLEVKMVC